MLELKSKKVSINKSPEALFAFLSKLENLSEIMPPAVERFEADENSFLFGMKGMPDVRLVLEEKKEPQFMRFKSASSKLDFSLLGTISPQGEHSELQFEFSGNFNAMLRMMVEKPLRNFIEDLAQNAAEVKI